MPPNSPYAPYAPPQDGAPVAAPYGVAQPLYRQNVFAPPGASTGALVGPGLRNAKLTLGIAQTVAMVVGMVLLVAGAMMGAEGGGGALMAVGGGLLGLWYLLLIAWGIVSLVWVYKFWSWIPPEQRHTNLWKRYISPGQALGFMFVPYFSFFWVFVINLGIADILERMRVAYPTDKGPARNLALFTSISAFVFFPAAPFIDYLFDKHVEGMAADMQARIEGRI